MKIQFNADKNTNGSEAFAAPFIAQIEKEMSRFSTHISRIEVHLSDEDGHKDGLNTKRCLLEVRMEGKQPIAVNHHSNSYSQAVGGALDKMTASLDTIVGKIQNHN